MLAAGTLALAVLTPSVVLPDPCGTGSPRVATAALWLLAATALMVVWYQVPVHDWQRAIMLGLAPYLLVFVTLLGLLQRQGWTDLEPITTTGTVAYLGLVVFWAWVAWRADVAPAAPPRRPA